MPLNGDIAAGAQLEIIDDSGNKHEAKPIYFIRDNAENSLEAEISAMDMTIKFDKIILNKAKSSYRSSSASNPMILSS
ncbi:MAG: hypothetical protein IPL33_10770 [Sphingobacteriales bacterium]|nr:hypothetical protein [Sphingobacteriales bacterium]